MTEFKKIRNLFLVGALGAAVALVGCTPADETADENGEVENGEVENGDGESEEMPESNDGEGESEPEMDTDGDDTASMPGTVVDVAMSNDDFSTLVAAVAAAELVETLQGDGPFTVFAPTNAAFAEVDGVEMLLEPEQKDALTSILTYHVVPGKLMAGDVIAETELTTVQGGTLEVVVDGETVMVGGATVTTSDIEAGNGVVHVIDTVLQP